MADTAPDSRFLDCDTGTVTRGIELSNTGQLVRIYYEAYGDPNHCPGRHDEGMTADRFVLDARAVEYVPFPADRHPTLLLDGEDGRRYVYCPMNAALPFSDKEDSVLAQQDGDELSVVGVYPALAVRDHPTASPMLPSKDDRSTDA